MPVVERVSNLIQPPTNSTFTNSKTFILNYISTLFFSSNQSSNSNNSTNFSTKKMFTAAAAVVHNELPIASDLNNDYIKASPINSNSEMAEDGEDVASFLIASLASLFIIFGGVFPYIPQYLKIRRESSAEGFSLYVCLALLTANILRIFFWFGVQFETPLLLQSIIMIITMLIVLHAAKGAELYRYNLLSSQLQQQTTFRRRRAFTQWQIRSDFWQWTDFESYIQFLLTATAILAIPYFFFLDNYWVVQSVGTLALVVEACQPVPQLWKNWKFRSTEGMSVAMVSLWALGDFFKTIYFVLRKTPLQFPICGVFQLGVDLAILVQVFFCFRSSSRTSLQRRRSVQLPPVINSSSRPAFSNNNIQASQSSTSFISSQSLPAGWPQPPPPMVPSSKTMFAD